MPISGTVDVNLLTFTLLRVTFSNLNVVETSFNWTLTQGSATFAMAANQGGETDTIDVVMRDNVQQKTYWVNHYVMVLTYGTTVDTGTLSGRYYDPDYGFVDITTMTPLTIPNTSLPTGGVVLFSGSASKAKLTFNSDQTTLLELDANNDGTYEWSMANPI